MKTTIPTPGEPGSRSKGERISGAVPDTLSTPFAMVMLDTVESNTMAMNRRLRENRIGIRPHIKVHRIPELARMQASSGAAGIACQTLEEVEIMVSAGFTEILLTNSIVDTHQLSRFMEIAPHAALAITAESDESIDRLAAVARTAGRKASVYVECDIGGARTGFANPTPAVALAAKVARSPSLQFDGLAAYLGGNPKCSDIEHGDMILAKVVSRLAHAGIDVPSVSVGGTVFAMRAWPDCPPRTVTEARPGNYSFYDATKVEYGLVTYEDCALRVLSTVVSRPNPTRVVLDVGWRMLSNNGIPDQSTYGHILEYPTAQITRLYTEHAVVELPESSPRPRIGEPVTIIPNSCDGVLASVNTLYGVRNGQIEQSWGLWERGVLK